MIVISTQVGTNIFTTSINVVVGCNILCLREVTGNQLDHLFCHYLVFNIHTVSFQPSTIVILAYNSTWYRRLVLTRGVMKMLV
jgi:hypothetical protein